MTSRSFVSFKTYALAFAVVLSPALMQTSSCGSMYTVSELQLIVGGQDRVDGFDPEVRHYDIALPAAAETAMLRAVSTNPSAEVWLDVEHASTEAVTTPSIVGGGDFPVELEPGHTSITLHVREGAVGSFYTLGIDVGFPCTDLGVRSAIAWGGGPHTLECDGPTTIVATDTIAIDNDVILDGEGLLTIDGDFAGQAVFRIGSNATAELRGLTITGGGGVDCVCIGRGCCFVAAYAVENWGPSLTLVGTNVSGNVAGIYNGGYPLSLLTVRDTTVSGNDWDGIVNGGDAIVLNSTVSANAAGYPDARAISNYGVLSLISSTVTETGYGVLNTGTATVANSILWEDICAPSLGYNIIVTRTYCSGSYDHPTDQVNVGAEALALGPLQDNGGPTPTHALGTGSVAIDQIPAENCVDASGEPLTTDQRGFPRDSMCDIGAFEVQP